MENIEKRPDVLAWLEGLTEEEFEATIALAKISAQQNRALDRGIVPIN